VRPSLETPRGGNKGEDILVVVGGVIPPQDFEALVSAGAAAIYPPGTVITEAAVDLLGKLEHALGIS